MKEASQQTQLSAVLSLFLQNMVHRSILIDGFGKRNVKKHFFINSIDTMKSLKTKSQKEQKNLVVHSSN